MDTHFPETTEKQPQSWGAKMNEYYAEKLIQNHVKSANRPEMLQTIIKNAKTLPIEIEPLGEIAYRAHTGTSWSPDIRYMQEEFWYIEHLADVWREISTADGADSAFARYCAGYRERKLTHLYAMGRCVSSMIVGPSGFPKHRAMKASESEHKRSVELMEWCEKAQRALKQNLGLLPGRYDGSVIYSDDSQAVEKLVARISSLERTQERMKAVNAIIRRKIDNSEKMHILQTEIGLNDDEIREIMTPDYMGRIGFPSYALQNNNQNIHRLRGRLEHLRKMRVLAERQKADLESGKEVGIVFNGGRIVDNVEVNRIQILFDAKPNAEIRTKLKQAGFRWAPSNSAWQAFRNLRSLERAKEILMA